MKYQANVQSKKDRERYTTQGRSYGERVGYLYWEEGRGETGVVVLEGPTNQTVTVVVVVVAVVGL